MATDTEEIQAREFLKRAEIRTMKKDIRALREDDALKERDKIAKIKTLEEQRAEQEKQLRAKEQARAEAEKAGLEGVLQKNEGQERMAEKDLKDYATEQERQQIFLLESQRFEFEKRTDAIDKEKDPALKLEKNKLLLQKRDQEAKLNSIIEQEKKLENEQKFISEKSQATTIPSEKKSLEQRRGELDGEIQNIEKKRWEAEKQVQETDNKVKETDRSLEQLVAEKNSLRDRILGMDKSLREIYSAVIAREEEKRRGQAQYQVAQREALSKAKAEKNEEVRREQRGGLVVPKKTGFLKMAPAPLKTKLAKSFEAEQEQRKKFLQNVEQGTNKNQAPQQKSNIQ
jgi:hypothetical protein